MIINFYEPIRLHVKISEILPLPIYGGDYPSFASPEIAKNRFKNVIDNTK
jgi:hypothetical protein